MYRFGPEGRIKPDAVIALLVGILAAYVIQTIFLFGGGGIFQTLIVTAVGGLYYHWRGVA